MTYICTSLQGLYLMSKWSLIINVSDVTMKLSQQIGKHYLMEKEIAKPPMVFIIQQI